MLQYSKLVTIPLGFTHNDINRYVLRNTKEGRKFGKMFEEVFI